MKTAWTSLTLALALSFTHFVRAAPPPRVELSRGPHSRTWGTVREIRTPRGVLYRTNATVVEFQTGLHRWDADQQSWVGASPRLDVFQDGAVVRGLQYFVIFQPNLASKGAIDIQLIDGQRLTGQITGLVYTEGTKSVLIAEVTNCAGEIGGPEQKELTFVRAFTDFNIDVKFVVQRGRFCQDIIIKERLPSPTQYGLSERANLEVLTEWITAPTPQKAVRVWEPAQDGQRALTDESLSFGSMEFATGQALSVGEPAHTRCPWLRAGSCFGTRRGTRARF
jgi:hypothetical protein